MYGGNGWSSDTKFRVVNGRVKGSGLSSDSITFVIRPNRGSNEHRLSGQVSGTKDRLTGTWEYNNRDDEGGTFVLNKGKLDIILVIVYTFGEFMTSLSLLAFKRH
jgi:hypothetical protein